MAEYLIPKSNVEDLRKKVQRIANKGANITFNIIDDNVPYDMGRNFHNQVLEGCRIEVSGEYKINGWIFVATIEHASPDNIIRVADTSLSDRIPERYRTAGRECEHCHIRRDRNDTYLVYNEDNDEWKQVGKTCLQSYTNGLNAETCAMFSDVMSYISKLDNDLQNRNFDNDFISFNSANIGTPMEEVRKKAYKYIEQHGYVPQQTNHEFNVELHQTNLPEATDEEVNQVTEFLDEEPDSSDYIRNARACWNKPVYHNRDSGLITSAVYSFFKAKEKKERERLRAQQQAAELAQIDNSYAGNVGDRVEFTVANVKVAYTKTFVNYYGEDDSYPVYRILGTDNKIYLWGKSSYGEVKVGETYAGTIKKLNERPNGEKQTEVTRCRLKKAATEPPSTNSDDNSNRRGFNFI